MSKFLNGTLQDQATEPQVYLNGRTTQRIPFYLNGRIVGTSLEQITLTHGNTTPNTRTLLEASTIDFDLRSIIAPDHTGLQRWSQLTLDSASAVLQYYAAPTYSFSNPDIVDSNLSSGFVGYRTWNDEVDSRSDIPDNDTGWWYVRDETQFVGRQTSDGNLVTLTGPEYAFAPSGAGITWLGHRTFANAQSGYAETGTTYYYDTGNSQVRRLQRTVLTAASWTTLASGATYDDVSDTELTLDTDLLLSSGMLMASLSENSIDEDKDDIWRIKVDLVSGTTTFTAYLLIDLENASEVSLSDLDAFGTTDTETFREAQAERFIDLEDVLGITPGTWESYNIASAAVKVQHSNDSGANWENIGVTGFQGLLPTEYSLNTTEALSAHRFGFRIHNNVIDSDILADATNRLRFLVTIEDDNMAEIERSIPFSAESRISLSSFPTTTNATARTVREGGTADAVDLTDLLSLITNWDDIHWDSAGAVVQQSEDEGATWATQTGEFQGLAISERTLTTDDLLANGNLSLALGEDTLDADIPHDAEDRLRVYVTLVSGDITRYVSIPYNFRAPNSLSDLTTFLTAAAQIFREGSAAATLEYTDLFNDITDIDDYNISEVTLIVQYSDDSGANWHPMDATGFQGLLPTEYTLTTTNLASMLEWMFNIHNNVIDNPILHDGENRLRFLLNIEGD